jgi:hypothetical protein
VPLQELTLRTRYLKIFLYLVVGLPPRLGRNWVRKWGAMLELLRLGGWNISEAVQTSHSGHSATWRGT